MPRFAQHFLINKHAIERIVGALQLSQTDHVIEIGPGKGALTSLLIPQCAQLIAIEVDPVWVQRLTQNYSSKTNFQVINKDILKFDFQTLPPLDKPWKVVGNLPYNLTSPILRILCEWSGWNEAWVMVQKEVGDRMTATVGSSSYGALTAGLSLSCVCKKVFNLSQGSFKPAPKVESSVIYMKRRDIPLSLDIPLTQRIIQAAFQQRRKTILNSLSHGLNIPKDRIAAALGNVGVSEQERPERISVDTFVLLMKNLSNELTAGPVSN